LDLHESPLTEPCPDRTANQDAITAAARHGPNWGRLLSPENISRAVRRSLNSAGHGTPEQADSQTSAPLSPPGRQQAVGELITLSSSVPPESDDERLFGPSAHRAWAGSKKRSLPLQDPRTKCRSCAQSGSFCEGGDKVSNTRCEGCAKVPRCCSWDLQGCEVRWSRKSWKRFRPNEPYVVREMAPYGGAPKAPAQEENTSDESSSEEQVFVSRKRPWHATGSPGRVVQDTEDEDDGNTGEDDRPPRKRVARLGTVASSPERSSEPKRLMVTVKMPRGLAQKLSTSERAAMLPGSSIPDRSLVPGPLGTQSPREASPRRAMFPPALPRLDDARMLIHDWEMNVGHSGSSLDGGQSLPTVSFDGMLIIGIATIGGAFSLPYLASVRQVQLHHNVGLHVEVIEPGKRHTIDATPQEVHTCIVHSGKLSFRFHSGEGNTVHLGPGGVVHLLPTGGWCTMSNRNFVHAVVHRIVSKVGGG